MAPIALHIKRQSASLYTLSPVDRHRVFQMRDSAESSGCQARPLIRALGTRFHAIRLNICAKSS